MSPVLRQLPFRALGTSATHKRFLDDDVRLAAHLGPRAHDAAEFLRLAPFGVPRLVPAAELAAALLAYAERHGAPEAVRENARLLAEPGTHVIVTGQQPGLLGGPLFTLHKAATAIRLCREIARVPGAPVVYVNTAFETISGFRREELLGRTCPLLTVASEDETPKS